MHQGEIKEGVKEADLATNEMEYGQLSPSSPFSSVP
jgi:hypothetical protein